MAFSKVFARLTRAGYAYTVVNTLVSIIAFGRNFLFMKTLGLGDVGQIAIMQSIVMLIGFVQFGTINGAYILFAERKPKQTRLIVDLLFWGGVALYILVLALALSGAGQLFEPMIVYETLVIGSFAGVATLFATWMNNLLIAKGALVASNLVSIVAVTISLGLALLSSSLGLSAALMSILAQPLFVAIGSLLVDREVRPSLEMPQRMIWRPLLAVGFMPYLGAVLTLGTYQLERWTIAFLLGSEDLGSFYLVMTYMTFFALVPTALLNVSFPRAMQALSSHQKDKFGRIRRQHLVEITIYGLVAAVLTIVALPNIIEHLIPEFQSSIILTYLALPGVLIFTLRDNAALILYSTKNTRPILVSGVILLFTYALLLAGAAYLDIFSLSNVVLLRGIAVSISTVYLFHACHITLRGLA
jgi:O-antigen/teichoic acid export membrane protein